MARALARGIIEVPNSAEAHTALSHLNARLARLESARAFTAEVAPLDAATRAHFVRYGAALLGAPSPLPQAPAARARRSGRGKAVSAVQQGTLDYSALRPIIEGVCEWLELLKLLPRRVYGLDDFDSQIIGRAIAQQLETDFEIANGDGFTHSKTLVVSADSRQLCAPPLRTVFPGQVLYAFNLHRETGAITPDLSSLAMPALSLPWHEERLSARKIAALIERIHSADPVQPSPQWPTRLEFYRARRALLTAGNSSFSRLTMLPEIS